MLASGVPRKSFPWPLPPYLLATFGSVVAVAAWAVSSSSPVSTDGVIAPAIPAEHIRSVAYVEPDAEARVDRLLVRPAAPRSNPRELAAFPFTFTGLHARASASPTGGEIAVLAVDGRRGSAASLTLVGLDGSIQPIEGGFDYLSPFAWTADGRRLAVVAGGDPGVVRVLEVDTATLSVVERAAFTSAFQVAPIGYSLDGGRLFIVVIDQAGSNLWAVRGNSLERVAELSPGRTRDWTLSPDGARVAFIDILSASSRTYVGKTLVIATGAVTSLPAGRNQVGAAWQPGNPLPVFGGPGGSLKLEDPSPEAAWVIPHRYAPLGDYLVVSTVSAAASPDARPSSTLWIATPDSREMLTDVPAASFAGWVRGSE